MRRPSVSAAFYVLAIVLFVLAAFVNDLAGLAPLETLALGLAAFAAAHVVP